MGNGIFCATCASPESPHNAPSQHQLLRIASGASSGSSGSSASNATGASSASSAASRTDLGTKRRNSGQPADDRRRPLLPLQDPDDVLIAMPRSSADEDSDDDRYARARPLPRIPPQLRNCDRRHAMLTPAQMVALRRVLPPSLRDAAWQRVFHDGQSSGSAPRVLALGDALAGHTAVVIAARVNDQAAVGALVLLSPAGWPEPPSPPQQACRFRARACVLFRLPRLPNSHAHAHAHTHARPAAGAELFAAQGGCELSLSSKFLVVGADAAAEALWLDADLAEGGSAPSPRFRDMARPLCRRGHFDVLAVEAWAIE